MKIFKSATLTLFTLLLLINTACKKDTPIDPPVLEVPTVTTTDIYDVSNTVAFSGGEISDDGGKTVLSRGVCWSTNSEPTITDSKTEDGTGAGSFSSALTGLTTKTMYYLRAYATTKNGTGYGSSMTFTTTSGFYFSPTTATTGNIVTVSFFGGDEVTFTQGSNCPSLHAMAQFRQGTSTILYPLIITYIDSTHFDATYNIATGISTGNYDLTVGTYPCVRTENNSFQVTN